MSIRQLYITLILLLATGCQQTIAADKLVAPINEPSAENPADKQLEINKDALLKGSSEQIRIDAATVMLLSDQQAARNILLDTLKQTENGAARIAVCKALIGAKATHKPVADKEDFIQPILDIFVSGGAAEVKAAGEATLIFKYEQISKPLEKMAIDSSLSNKIRLNAIETLKIQPDVRAMLKLIDLLNDPDKEIASESEEALKSIGITLSKDTAGRRKNIERLKHKNRNEFLTDRLVYQETRLREFEAELNVWQELYLSALNNIYDNIKSDEEKGKFLDVYLGSSKPAVKTWALDKDYQDRIGTASKLPAEFGDILINLISDPDKNVRLKTAKMLSLMSQLNSAQKLLEQIEVEQDEQVRTELLVALGGVCHYAASPNAEFKIQPEIKNKTLKWAAKYLAEEDPQKAQKGAEVIMKLLEQNSLPTAEADKYLDLLVERYNRQKNAAETNTLGGELLSIMAGLCAQSVYKTDAGKVFKPLFEEALLSETDLVREAAADGLIYIDKAAALKQLRKTMVNDNSAIIRKKLTELAGEVGGQEDLTWLGEKMGTPNENEAAWQAMLKIFRRSDAGVLEQWLAKFDSQDSPVKLSNEQWIDFLETTEKKAGVENNAEALKTTRERLAQLYRKSGRFEQAAAYLGAMRQAAKTPEEKEEILGDLLEVYLKWPNFPLAAQLITNRLLVKDLEPNDIAIQTINDYLKEPSAGADPNAAIKALSKIEVPQRPEWDKQIRQWVQQFVPAATHRGGHAKDPNQK